MTETKWPDGVRPEWDKDAEIGCLHNKIHTLEKERDKLKELLHVANTDVVEQVSWMVALFCDAVLAENTTLRAERDAYLKRLRLNGIAEPRLEE